MSKHQFNRNFAVVIGINDYTNGIRELETAVPDALKLAQILQKQHQALKPQYQTQNRYEVQLILNKRATLHQLNQLISDFKKGQIPLDNEKVAVTKDDRVLFYFAGHGIALEALENQEGPVGYLIPQDATSGDSSTYLPMQELHDALNALPCRHMLAILDCCFAGAFRWASLKREIVPKVTVYKERYDRFISDRAWQVITSAADDQKALDSLGLRGKVIDGNEVHSPFAKALFDALRGGADEGADSNKDGIITATELYSYLRDQVEILTENHYKLQTPGLCPLKKHDKGEFIFLLPDFDRDKLEDAPPLNLENNPYRGLQSYNEKDSHLFFGRNNLIEKLCKKAVDNKQALTLVLGASGTGKSSLMKAGLLPRLRDSQELQFKILDPMRPGESPLKALAQVCLPIATTMTAAELAKDEQALANIIERWSKNYPNTKLLLPVDQFEELITLCKSDQEREQFQKLIKNVFAKYPNKIHVVITLRLDFEAQFQTSVLKNFWNDETRFVVPPMTQDEFREVIEKPASEKVVYFDPPSLVDELINEVVQMPGALPLLSFTLSELYLKYLGDRTRDNRALTKKDYEELGRVFGSITKRANEEYERLVGENPAYEKTVRWVMLRMISLQGGELARRQVLKSELVYPFQEQSDHVKTVIERFSQARLIVAGSNPQGEPYVEPAHDALMQGWDKLLEWIKQEQENLALQQRLTPAANDWLNQERPESYLWNTNPRLDLLREVIKNSEDNWLNQLEMEFVKRSIRKREEEVIEAEKQTISTISRASKAFLASDQQLEALVEAVKAGKKLKQLQHKYSFWTDPKLCAQVRETLQQVIGRVKERNRLEAHQGRVIALGLSSDCSRLASADDHGTICLWDRSGKQLAKFQASQDQLWSASFSPNGSLLAIVSPSSNAYGGVGQDSKFTVSLWNLESQQQLSEFKGHPSWVYDVSFSPDGNLLATAGSDGIRLWTLSGQPIPQFPGGTQGNVSKVVFHPNDNLKLLAATLEDSVRFWDFSGEEVFPLPGWSPYLVSEVIFNQDGSLIATIGKYGTKEYGTIRLWNSQGQQLKEFAGHGAIFSLKDNLLATSQEDYIRLWDLSSGQVLVEFNTHHSWIDSIIFSPDGQQLITAGRDGIIRIWDLKLKQQEWELRGKHRIMRVSWSKDGSLLATAEDDGNTRLWDLSGKLLAEFQVPNTKNSIIPNVIFSSDGKQLATTGRDRIARLWDVKSKKLLVQSKKSLIEGSFLLTTQEEDGTIHLWNWEGKQLARFKAPQSKIASVSLSPDRNLLVTQEEDRTACLRDLEGNPKVVYKGHPPYGIDSVFFSPNGKLLATAGRDGTARLWNLDGQELARFKGMPNGIVDASFSPDSKLLVTAGLEGIAKLWDLESKQQIAEFNGGAGGQVFDLKFSPDGKLLAMVINNGIVKLCRVGSLDELPGRACDWVRDYLENNPNVSESDRRLCENIPSRPARQK